MITDTIDTVEVMSHCLDGKASIRSPGKVKLC